MVTTILVVEDNEDDRHLYRRALKTTGYPLIVEASAEAGLARVAEAQPDLILLDYNLPDMTGLAFMERLKEASPSPIPVIMLTGEGSEPVAVEAMKGGASDYVVKDTAGRYLRLLPSVVDRTLAAHAQLLQARRLMDLHQAILGTVADGILGVNADGRIRFANPAAERMLLCPAHGLTDHPLTDFLRQTDGAMDWASHPLGAAHDGTVTLCRDSDLFRRNGGTSFPVSYTASPLDFDGDLRFGWVLVFQDITERKKAEEELIQTARYDTLTGLPNRVMFDDYLPKALSRAERGHRHVALLFLDLDGFKAVNDTLGHQAGDQLLQLVAQRLVKCVRAGDLVSRLGGDEFTIVIEDGLPDQLDALAGKIVRTLEAPFDLGGYTAAVSASIGIALYPKCGVDAHTLIQKADSAMYEVKKGGKRGHAFCCGAGCEGTDCSVFQDVPRQAAVRP